MSFTDEKNAMVEVLAQQRTSDSTVDNEIAKVRDRAYVLELEARKEFAQKMLEVKALHDLADYAEFKDDVIERKGEEPEDELDKAEIRPRPHTRRHAG